MTEYRRPIAAGCGGIPPSEVDAVVSILLKVSILPRPLCMSLKKSFPPCSLSSLKNRVCHLWLGVVRRRPHSSGGGIVEKTKMKIPPMSAILVLNCCE